MSYNDQFARIYPFLLLMLLAVGCAGPRSVSETLDGSGIIADLNASRQAHDIPAIAAIVVRADTLLQGAAVGVRRKGDPAPVELNDLFHLGPLTKAISATTIASLVEDGSLSWESRPADIFPAWKDDIHPAAREITLDQLLRHSSGLTSYLDEDSPEVEAMPPFPDDPVAERQIFARNALQYAPLFTPGSRRKYSNAGYVIAAAMAEKVSGLAWEALVEERLFRPLGMHTARFGRQLTEQASLAWGHMSKEDTLQAVNPVKVQRPAWRHPADDIFLSITDYGKFLQEHLQGLRGNSGILKAATVQYLHEPMGIDPEGLGWNSEEEDGISRSTVSSGGSGLFYAAVQLETEGNIAVAVFSNSMRETDEKAINELLLRLAGRYRELPAPAD